LGGAPKAAREGACAPHPVEYGSLLTKIEAVLLEHCQRLLVHRVAKPTANLDALLLIDALNLLKPFRLAYPQAVDGTERLDQALRQALVDALVAQGVPGDFSFITQQHGMFSFSGLTKEQVETLREKHAIYIVGSGRINVAGMTPDNMDRLCDAIADIL